MTNGVIIGVLLDVSGSMRVNYEKLDLPTDKVTMRTESIFKTIIQIAKSEVDQNNNEIFALAFGLNDSFRYKTCDLLELLSLLSKQTKNHSNSYEPLIRLLTENGAPYTRKYIEGYLTKKLAGFFYDFYSNNLSDLKEVINDLPLVCTDQAAAVTLHTTTIVEVPWFFPDLKTAQDNVKKIEELKTQEQVFQALNKAMLKLLSPKLESMQIPKAKTMKQTIELLNDLSTDSEETSSSKNKTLSADQIKFLVELIKPIIYGETPMCRAISLSLNLLDNYVQNGKVLFILTDGNATDGRPIQFAKELQDKNIQVFICLITSENIRQPRSLFYKPDQQWTKQQKEMFELSSIVENNHSALSILIERGWELPLEGQSRLFVQANHPEVIDEFSDTVSQMAESNDVFLNIIGRVSLDIYINSAKSSFKVRNQIGATCYAHAVAAVLHLAMKRIVGRVGGVPKFEILLQELIENFGKEGAYVAEVLEKWTPKYRLRFKIVSEIGARKAINARRPVVAKFYLFSEQWTAFSRFYQTNPKGVLKKNDLKTTSYTEPAGHAVVLMRCDPNSLTFMNSWGKEFADDGFFKVENQETLGLDFYDVFWILNDLKESEKRAYEHKKLENSKRLVEKLPFSLRSLPYECPLCKKSSPANTFSGHFLVATCPRCERDFRPTPLGFVLNFN